MPARLAFNKGPTRNLLPSGMINFTRLVVVLSFRVEYHTFFADANRLWGHRPQSFFFIMSAISALV